MPGRLLILVFFVLSYISIQYTNAYVHYEHYSRRSKHVTAISSAKGISTIVVMQILRVISFYIHNMFDVFHFSYQFYFFVGFSEEDHNFQKMLI